MAMGTIAIDDDDHKAQNYLLRRLSEFANGPFGTDGNKGDVLVSGGGTSWDVKGWHFNHGGLEVRDNVGTLGARITGINGSIQQENLVSGQPAQYTLNPGTSPPSSGPIAEYIAHRTNLQTTNYGRISFTAHTGLDGILQEYGGSVTPQPFIIQCGVENPAATFTNYFFLKCTSVSLGGESSQAGAVMVGDGDTTPINKISLLMTLSGGGAGHVDSHAVLWEGKFNTGVSGGATWWRTFANLTNNSGASGLVWQSNLNGGGWNNRMRLNDTGTAIATSFIGTTVALVDGATPALDASLGTIFTLSAAGDRTIAVPTNPTIGQQIIIRHFASGANRTLALNTGAGGFRFGTDITGLTATTSGTTDYIGATYNATADKWDVISYVRGF